MDTPARAVPFTGLAAPALVLSGRAVLAGLSVRNMGTAAGYVEVQDGTAAGGAPVAELAVPASGIASLAVPPGGIVLEIGCYLVVSGVIVTGAAWLGYARLPRQLAGRY